MGSQAVEEKTLGTLIGPLAQTFPQLDRATILHSDQLTTERRTNPELRNQWFYTADAPLYTVEKEDRGDEAFLYLGRGKTNPVFNNIAEATQQLIRTGNYVLPNEKRDEIDAVIKAEDTLRVKLSDLRLQRDSDFRYFEIDTANYGKLNPEQRRFAERVYGSGNDFIKNMKMLNKDGIREITVYVLDPDYVKQNTPKDGALVRASELNDFNYENESMFSADGMDVGIHGGLRGVPNVVAEGDAQKIRDAYQTILGANPYQVLKAMTPEIATGLSELATRYFGNLQKQ